jgi:hypothetical protein
MWSGRVPSREMAVPEHVSRSQPMPPAPGNPRVLAAADEDLPRRPNSLRASMPPPVLAADKDES